MNPLPFDQRAVFVAGQAKSGTTLLVALLDRHPELLALPEETAYFPTVLRRYAGRSRREQVDYLTGESHAAVMFGGRDRWGRREREYGEFPTGRLREEFERVAFAPENAGRDLLVLFLEAYAAVLGRPLGDVRRWIEKTPANRDHLPAIAARFPDSRLILTIRDPRAALAAQIRLEKTRQSRRFSAYLCVAHWRAAARLALRSREATGGGALLHGRPSLVVPYEGLVTEPVRWVRAMCGFLGVDPAYADAAPLAPSKAGRPWRGNSASGAEFGVVSTEPAERWRGELSADEIGWAEWHCRDLMPALGYEPLLARRSLRHWVRAVRGETPREYLKSRWRSIRGRFKT